MSQQQTSGDQENIICKLILFSALTDKGISKIKKAGYTRIIDAIDATKIGGAQRMQVSETGFSIKTSKEVLL